MYLPPSLSPSLSFFHFPFLPSPPPSKNRRGFFIKKPSTQLHAARKRGRRDDARRINTREICHLKVINDSRSSRVKDFCGTSLAAAAAAGRGRRTLQNRRRMKARILRFCTRDATTLSCAENEKPASLLLSSFFFHGRWSADVKFFFPESQRFSL